MATISKNQNTKGVSYRARIKSNGRVVASKTFQTKRDALIWAKRIESDTERVRALGSKGARISFTELAKEYVDQWNKKDVDHPRRVDWWVRRLGDIRIIDINADIVEEHLQNYAAGKVQQWCGVSITGYKIRELNKPRKPATVNRMHAALSSVLTYAVKKRYLPNNVARQIPSQTENNKRERYLSDEERKVLLEAVDNSTWSKLRLLVVLALHTGCRRGELLGLTWDRIDFKNRKALLLDTKNGDNRTVPLSRPAIAELQKWREIGTGLLFPSAVKKGRPFVFEKHWLKALKEAGIENFHFHDLRHTSASTLINSGVDLYTVGQILGHRDVQTTSRYAHLEDRTKQKAIDNAMNDLEVSK